MGAGTGIFTGVDSHGVVSDKRWLAHVLRRARRDADLSQRQLARYAGVPKSVIGDIEAGVSTPSFPVAERLLAVCGYQVTVTNGRGREVVELLDDDRRDRIGRRYPAHLDVRELSPIELTWRAEVDHRPRPLSDHTYRLNRMHRDTDRWHGFYGQTAEFWRPPGPDKAYVRSVLGYEPVVPLPLLPDVGDWLCPGVRTDLNALVRNPEDRFPPLRPRSVKELRRMREEALEARRTWKERFMGG